MSKIALSGDASGTGTFTIASPNSNSNYTLTLPAATGTVALQGGTGVGKVLQVVNATYSTETSTTTNAYVDTGLSASITPTSSSSKILVLVDVAGVYKTSTDTGVNIKLLRGSTDLIIFAKAAAYTNSTATNLVGTQGCNYLDSPSTTSSTTYKVQFASTANTSLARVQDNAQVSTITLLEIAA